MFERVLLCHDGSDGGRRALKRGLELAQSMDAKVYVLSIISSASANSATTAAMCGEACMVDVEGDRRRSLAESIARLHSIGVDAEVILAIGDTIEVISNYAKQLAIDLVVVGVYPEARKTRWWSATNQSSLAETLQCCFLVAQNE